MARLKHTPLPSRSWERGRNVLLSKAAVLHILRAVELIGGMDLESGLNQSKREKAIRLEVESRCRVALEDMKPRPDVCAQCGHHKTYHGEKYGVFKAGSPCTHIVSCWNDTCGCPRFVGQK